VFGLALKFSIRVEARLVCRLSFFANIAAYGCNRVKKPVGWKVPRGRTLSGQPGRIVRPPYTTDNLRAPGQPPESLQLDTTLFDAMAERRRSPRPPKKMARKGTPRTVLQNGQESFRVTPGEGESSCFLSIAWLPKYILLVVIMRGGC